MIDDYHPGNKCILKQGAVLRVVRFRSVSVSTVTKYNMNDLSINVRFIAGEEMFLFITYFRPAVE